MPRAPGLRARSKNAVTGVIEAASDLTANLHAADEAKLLEEGENAVLLPCLSAYHQSLRILFGHGGSHPSNEQLTDLTHGFLEADIPNTLLACLKTITPSSLIAPGEYAARPGRLSPLIMTTLSLPSLLQLAARIRLAAMGSVAPPPQP